MFNNNMLYSFDDILLVPEYNILKSRSECDISVDNYNSPIVMSPMDTVTSVDMIKYFIDNNYMATIHRYFESAIKQFQYIDQLHDYYKHVFFAVGSVHKYENWILDLHKMGVTKYCIDMAHGDSKLCLNTIKYIKGLNPNHLVMAGNVATAEGVNRLNNVGVDYIRCGIGCGSACTTRTTTGFGIPQFSSLLMCCEANKEHKTPSKIIADGGIKNNGDVAKAIAAGADYVMLGKMLASTSLSNGESYNYRKEIIPLQYCVDNVSYEHDKDLKIKYKSYRGMASAEARNSVMAYNSVEGVSGLVPYIGTTDNFINNLNLNLKAAMSYCGSVNWNEFKAKVKYVLVSSNTVVENNTHVISPNNI